LLLFILLGSAIDNVGFFLKGNWGKRGFLLVL